MTETIPQAGAETVSNDSTQDLATLTVNTVKTLSMDAVQKANSGHPGTPMALAPLAYALWTRVMKYDSGAPDWPDRDRFVLSCGHASMLIYSMLHLTGYELSHEHIVNFRQLGSPAAGHPEYGEVPGVETTTGPLGQGIANAVGMALAESMLAARHNADDSTLVDHHTWVIASDGDLMEGVAAEAASLAGHLGLGKLCVFWDDNRITIDGSTDLSFSEDVAARYASYGWHVLHCGDDASIDDYVQAAEAAKAETGRPTLVVCRTHIAAGSPNKQDTSAAHGAALGEDEVRLTKQALGWPEDEHFLVPAEVTEHMNAAGVRGRDVRTAWESTLAAVRESDAARADAFEGALAGTLPDGWDASVPSFEAGTSLATRKASGKTLAAIGAVVTTLVGGSCDLAGSNNTTLPGAQDVTADDYSGRTLHFGVREHGMGGVMNGMALHGGLRPYGGTFLIFSDYMRPSIRLAALMQLPVIYVFTHDSIGVGEDGPTHQPIEQLASLRAIPGLTVLRPADANETVEAWRMALQAAGPVALCLTRQGLPVLDRTELAAASGTRAGAYVLHPGAVSPDVVFMATGSEVSAALGASELLRKEGVAARVISMPCWEAFDGDIDALCGGCTVRVGVEAGASMGWHRWVGPQGGLVTLDRFGASAPAGDLMKKFGFTAENIAEVARTLLAGAERGSADAERAS